MAFLGRGGQPRHAGALVQARPCRLPRRPTPVGYAALLCLASFGGCSNPHTTGPEVWWHESVGGKIAQNRPPPPGDNDPYPNLATVPPKPPAADTATWNRVSTALLMDRINASEAAALAPIPPPSPTRPPARPGQQAQNAGGAAGEAAGATLVGATPPPKPPGTAPPAALPPVTMPPPGQAAPTSAETAQRVANGNLPAIQPNEPPRADIAPPPPAPLVPPTAMAPLVAPAPPEGNEIDFSIGSSALTDAALAEVKALAAERNGRPISVTGYGDATASDAVGQSNAVGLGFARAQALATALVAQGVPYARLRLNAEAAGRGATLRLLQ